MNRLAPLMSSASGDWQTPANVLELVRAVGPIVLDPCTTRRNPTGAEWICVQNGPRQGDGERVLVDGLAVNWRSASRVGLTFLNPPYGREIGAWTEKCAEVGCDDDAEVIALLPARTDTRWWQSDCVPPTAQAVCFWRGRLTFVGAPAPAPFPSALVYWGPRKHRFADVFSAVGAIWI